MELTKHKALEICLELWEWLTETGGVRKEAWPKWKDYGNMKADCPACEYAMQIYGKWRLCPIWGDCEHSIGCPCHEHTSYDRWLRSASRSTRKAAACKMVALIKSKMEKKG